MRYIVAEVFVKYSTARIKKSTAIIFTDKKINHGRIYVHGFLFYERLLSYHRVRG